MGRAPATSWVTVITVTRTMVCGRPKPWPNEPASSRGCVPHLYRGLQKPSTRTPSNEGTMRADLRANGEGTRVVSERSEPDDDLDRELEREVYYLAAPAWRRECARRDLSADASECRDQCAVGQVRRGVLLRANQREVVAMAGETGMGCEHGEWYVEQGNMVCGRGCERRASDIIADLPGSWPTRRANWTVLRGCCTPCRALTVSGTTSRSVSDRRSGVRTRATVGLRTNCNRTSSA